MTSRPPCWTSFIIVGRWTNFDQTWEQGEDRWFLTVAFVRLLDHRYKYTGGFCRPWTCYLHRQDVWGVIINTQTSKKYYMFINLQYGTRFLPSEDPFLTLPSVTIYFPGFFLSIDMFRNLHVKILSENNSHCGHIFTSIYILYCVTYNHYWFKIQESRSSVCFISNINRTQRLLHKCAKYLYWVIRE